MGKIKQGILGGFSGKVAGIVGTSWKGRAVIKAMPLSVANPRTSGQVAQRTAFSKISKIGSILLSLIIRVVYNPIAGNVSGYNKFASQNKEMFDGTGTFVPAKAYSGGGTLPNETITGADVDLSTKKMQIYAATSEPAGSPRLTDKRCFWAYDFTRDIVWASTGAKDRSDNFDELELISGDSAEIAVRDVALFSGYISADGRQVGALVQCAVMEITTS